MDHKAPRDYAEDVAGGVAHVMRETCYTSFGTHGPWEAGHALCVRV